MIRKLITPQQQQVMVLLPESFVGKQIELIAFAIEEPETPTPTLDSATQTQMASEQVLAKDWLTQTEDEAWKDL